MLSDGCRLPTAARRTAGSKLWTIPPKSPDLNPIERIGAWLKKKLRAMDLAGALEARFVLGKTAYIECARRVLKSSRAQSVAKNQANTWHKVCKAIVQKKGAAGGN